MFELLLPLVLSLPNAKHVPVKTVNLAIQDIEKALSIAEPLPFKKDKKENTAKLLFAWSYYESAWRLNIVGDKGVSCGRMQTHRNFVSCKKATTDGVFGYIAALDLIRTSITKCGSILGGMRMYSTGSCYLGAKNVLARFKRAGIDTNL